MESESIVEKFWAKVDRRGPNDCWPWTGRAQGNRRGILYGYFGRGRRANRVAWEITHGPIPAGLVIRHTCDNGICVNPAHLLAGTQKQNVDDRYERGRDNHVRGSAHGIAKLDEAKVREIKALLRQGVTQVEVAARYGVSTFPISCIKHGRGWTHVE